MKKNVKQLDIANGPLYKNIFIFAVPIIFSSLLQMFFNSADTIVVGKFAGDTALAAVGSTGSIVFLITSLFHGLATGSNVVIARQLGSGDHDGIKKAAHTSITIAMIGGVLMSLIGVGRAEYFLKLMDTPADIINLSAKYIRIYFMGSVFSLLYNFGSAVLRSKGDTKRPLYFLIISGLANVLLNLYNVVILKLSVIGVASATVVSQAIAAFLVLRVLLNEDDATKLQLRELRIDFNSLIQILKTGVPAGLSVTVFALSNVVIQSSINSFDSTDIVAGNSVGANIENYVYIGYIGFTQATITFTSHCMGAGRFDRIKEIMFKTLLLTTVGAAIMSSLVYFAGQTVLQLYTNEQAVMDVAMIRIAWVASFLALNGILDVIVNSLRGMGYSTIPTILMVIGICGVRLLWIYNVFPIYKSLQSIYLCFPASWILTAAIELLLWTITYREVAMKSKIRQF